MKRPSLLFACLFVIIYSCKKTTTAAPAPEQSVYGYLKYSTIALDGPGLYYQKELDSVSLMTADPAVYILLLSNGHGGFIQDGAGIDSLYHKYLNVRTRLSFRETRKSGCFGPSRVVCSNVPIIDTLAFTLAP